MPKRLSKRTLASPCANRVYAAFEKLKRTPNANTFRFSVSADFASLRRHRERLHDLVGDRLPKNSIGLIQAFRSDDAKGQLPRI